jgi:dihydroorotate dehydrogenase electron transfer subunit
MALQSDIAVALFSDSPIPNIPSAVEIYPVQDLQEALAWADILMLDMTVDELERLRGRLRMKPEDRLPCSAQALILTAMPCSGIAECGACFVPGRRKWKQACQDGPVFDLNELTW